MTQPQPQKRTDLPTKSESESDGMSRRDLLRRGAAAGIAVGGVGYGSARLDLQPVQNVRANPLIPIAAVGALAYGAYTLVDSLSDVAAEKIREGQEQRDAYKFVQNMDLSLRPSLEYELERLNPDGDPLKSDATAVVYEDISYTAGETINAGGSVSEAIEAATEVADKWYIEALMGINESWNGLAKTVLNAADLNLIEASIMTSGGNQNFVTTGSTANVSSLTVIDNVVDGMDLVDLTSSSSVRIDPTSYDSVPNKIESFSYVFSNSDRAPLTTLFQNHTRIKASHDGQTASFDLTIFDDLVTAINEIHQHLTSTAIDDIANSLNTGIAESSIDRTAWNSGRNLYMESSTDLGRTEAEQLAIGMTTEDLGVTVTIQAAHVAGGDELTGILFLEVVSDITLSEGEMINSSAYNRGSITVQPEGAPSESISFDNESDIDIVAIHRDDLEEGETPQVTYEDRPSWEPSDIDTANLQEIVKRDQQYYDDLEQRIAELDYSGGAGGLFGGSDNRLIIAVGGLLGAFALFGGN